MRVVTVSAGSGRGRSLVVLLGFLLTLAGLTAVPAGAADTDAVCGPLDSSKIDTTGDPASVSVQAPPGKVITRYCVKAGSAQQGGGPVYVFVSPPASTVVITHPSGKAVSHYSVEYAAPTGPASPAVAIVKTASAVHDVDGNGPDAGDTVTYSFRVTNTGNAGLKPVTVTDPKVGAVSCPTGALAPGASVSCTDTTYTLTQEDADRGFVLNTATATGTSTTGTVVTSQDTVTTSVAANADLVLDKTAGAVTDADANGTDAGDTLTYSFEVTNTGNVTLQPVTVADPMLGAVSCPTGTLAPGASVSCSPRTYALTQDDVNAGRVDNTATATGTTPDGTRVTASDSTTSAIPVLPALELDKTASAVSDADGNGVDLGDTVTYGFTVTNTGNVPLQPVTVADPKVGAVVCPSDSLPPGGSLTCSPRTYTLTQGDVDSGTIENTATATGTAPDGARATDTDSTTTPLSAAPAVVLDKSAPPISDVDGNGIDAGDTIAYAFTVTNTGNVTLTQVGVTDDLVGAVTCRSSVLAPLGSTTCTADPYVLTQAEVDAGSVVNTATATGTAPSGTNVTGTDTTTTTVVARPALGLTKTASRVADVDGNGPDAGDTVAYAFEVTNVGNLALDPVTVSDPKAGLVTCPAGALVPGASVSCSTATYTLTQADVDHGRVGNTATATGTTSGGVQVTATSSTSSLVPAAPGLALVKTASVTADPDGNGADAGDTVTYSFEVTNTGNLTLAPVTVSDPQVGPVVCPAGPLAPGAVRRCSSVVHVLSQDDVTAGIVSNTATAIGGTPSGGTVTASDTVITPLVRATADLALTKDVDEATPRVGDTVTYTLRATNRGSGDARDVVLRDTLPDGVTFVSAQAPCTQAAGTVTCAIGTVPGGGSRAVTITATVDPLPVGPAHQHLLDVQKAEVHVDLDAAQTRTVDVSCAPGYLVTDGSGRTDHVDQGTGTLADVRVTESRAVDAGTWRVTMTNRSGGRAQAKAFVVCVSRQGGEVEGHRHELVLGAPVTTTERLAGRTTATLSCAPGEVPVQPGHRLDGTARVMTTSTRGDTGWTWTVDTTGGTATSADLSLRCLSRTTSEAAGHTHELALEQVRQGVTVPPGETVEVTLSCAADAKGVVAGYDAEAGLVSLGNDPRPVVRVFKLLNPTSEPLQADLFLHCLALRNQTATGTGTVVVNTATASTSSAEPSTGDNTDTARLDVDTSTATGPAAPPAPAAPVAAAIEVGRKVVRATVRCASGLTCTGRATLVAARTVEVAGRTVRGGTVLARARYEVGGGRTEVRLAKTKAGKRALDRLGRARLVVGGSAEVVRLR